MAGGARKTNSATLDPVRGPGSRPTGRVVEYQTYIDGQLKKTRSRVKWVDFWTSATTLGIGVLAYLLVAALIDHWIVPGGLGFFGRLILLVGLLAGIGVHLALNFLPHLLKRVNPVYAAAAIERAGPMKNTLVNFLLLRRQPDAVPEGLLEAMKEQAAVRLSAVPGDAPVDRSALIRWGYVLVAVLLAAVAYALAAPKDALRSVGRVIAPWADLAAPTRVTLEDLTPGDVDKRRDDVVEIKLRTRGMRGGDTATVFYSATGLPEDDVAVTMAGDDQMHWAATIPSAGEGLKQDVFYYVQAGDTKSPQYRVRVLATPVIGTSSVRYEYPAYTGLPPRTVEGQGDLKALEGTTVVLTADANQSIASAFVAFDQARNKDVELNVDKTRRRAIGSFPLLLTKDRQKPLHGSYVLRFTNIDGQENPKPVEHRIEVVPDQAPELKVAEPTTPAEQPIQVPLAGSLRISLSAQDVDFQLAQLSVVYERFGAEVREETSLIEPRSGPFSNTFLFTPQSLGLKAGDRVTFRGRARDNRTPEPNVTESARYTIVIGGGAADPNQQPQPQQGNPQQQPNQQQNPNQQQGQGRPPERGQQNPEQQPQQGQPQNGQPQNGQQGQGQQQPGQQGQGQQGQGQQQPGDPQQGQSQPQNGQQQPGQQQSGQQQQQPGMQGDQRNGEQRGDQQNGQQQNGQGQSQAGDRQNGQQQQAQQQGDSKQGDQKQNGLPEQQAGNQQQGTQQGNREDEKPLDQNDPGRIFEELKKHYDKQAGNGQQQQQPGDQKQDNQQASAGERQQQEQQQPGSQQQQRGQDQQQGQNQQPGQQQQSGQQQQGQNQQSGQQQQSGDGQNSEMRKPGEEGTGADRQNQPNAGGPDKHGRDQEPADQKSGAGQRPDQQPKGDEAGSGKRGGSGGGQDAGGQSKQEKPEQSGGSGGKGTNQQQPSDQQNGTAGGSNEAMQRQDGAGSGANEQRAGENNGQGREVSRKPSEAGNAAEQGRQQPATGDKPGNTEGARPTNKPAAGDNPSGNKAEGPKPGGNSAQQDMQQPGGEQRNGAQPNSGNPTPNQQGKQTQQGNSGATGGTAPNKDDKRPEQRPGEQGPTAEGNAKPSANAQQPAGGDRSGGAKGNSNNEGSPEQQEMSKPRDPGGAASSQNQQESGQGNEAKSPSGSRSESDARGDSSGDRNGKGEQGGGQKSNQKGTGAAGSNTAGDQGAGAAQEQGDSATGNQAGDKVRGKQPSGGEASGQKGAGSSTRAGGNEAGGESESANTGGDRQGDPSNRNPQNMEQGGKPGGSNSGGGGTPEGDFNPQPRQAPEPGGDEANLEYTKKVTDLTLDKLKNDVEKGTVDPELLKKFGSQEAMEQFVRRWDEMRKAAQQQGPQADAAQKQYQDTLKGLGLRPRTTDQQGTTAGDDDSRQLRGARRSAPPAKYADQYRAYTTGIGQGEQK